MRLLVNLVMAWLVIGTSGAAANPSHFAADSIGQSRFSVQHLAAGTVGTITQTVSLSRALAPGSLIVIGFDDTFAYRLQHQDGESPGHVEITTDPAATFELANLPLRSRPERRAVDVVTARLADALPVGTEITIRYRQLPVPTIATPDLLFPVYVVTHGGERWHRIDAEQVSVLGGERVAVSVVAPTVVRPSQLFSAHAQAIDRYENATTGPIPGLEILINGRFHSRVPAGIDQLLIPDLIFTLPGTYRLQVRTAGGGLQALSNPIVVNANVPVVSWETVHKHSRRPLPLPVVDDPGSTEPLTAAPLNTSGEQGPSDEADSTVLTRSTDIEEHLGTFDNDDGGVAADLTAVPRERPPTPGEVGDAPGTGNRAETDFVEATFVEATFVEATTAQVDLADADAPADNTDGASAPLSPESDGTRAEIPVGDLPDKTAPSVTVDGATFNDGPNAGENALAENALAEHNVVEDTVAAVTLDDRTLDAPALDDRTLDERTLYRRTGAEGPVQDDADGPQRDPAGKGPPWPTVEDAQLLSLSLPVVRSPAGAGLSSLHEVDAPLELGGAHLFVTPQPVQGRASLRDWLADDSPTVHALPHVPADHRFGLPGAHRFVEIKSGEGTFEWFGHRYAERGLPMAFAASGAPHKRRWGRQISTGLTAYRTALETYVTSGTRMFVDFAVDGKRPGSRSTGGGPHRIVAQIAGTAPLARIELVRSGEVVSVQSLDQPVTDRPMLRICVHSDSRPHRGGFDLPRNGREWIGFVRTPGARIIGFHGPGFRTEERQAVVVDDESSRADFITWTRGSTSCFHLQLERVEEAYVVELNVREGQEDPDFEIRSRTPSPTPSVRQVIAEEDLQKGGATRRFDIAGYQDWIRVETLGDFGPRDAVFEFVDNGRTRLTDYYYIKATQVDDQVAWSSPVFVGGFDVATRDDDDPESPAPNQ